MVDHIPWRRDAGRSRKRREWRVCFSRITGAVVSSVAHFQALVQQSPPHLVVARDLAFSFLFLAGLSTGWIQALPAVAVWAHSHRIFWQ